MGYFESKMVKNIDIFLLNFLLNSGMTHSNFILLCISKYIVKSENFNILLTPFLDQNVPLCCGLTATADCYLQRSIWRWQKTIHFSKAGKRSKTFLIFLLQQSRKYLRFLVKYFTQIRNRIWSLYWDIFVDEKSMFFELRIGIRKSSEREREREWSGLYISCFWLIKDYGLLAHIHMLYWITVQCVLSNIKSW